jgi:hypothetical protein
MERFTSSNNNVGAGAVGVLTQGSSGASAGGFMGATTLESNQPITSRIQIKRVYTRPFPGAKYNIANTPGVRQVPLFSRLNVEHVPDATPAVLTAIDLNEIFSHQRRHYVNPVVQIIQDETLKAGTLPLPMEAYRTASRNGEYPLDAFSSRFSAMRRPPISILDAALDNTDMISHVMWTPQHVQETFGLLGVFLGEQIAPIHITDPFEISYISGGVAPVLSIAPHQSNESAIGSYIHLVCRWSAQTPTEPTRLEIVPWSGQGLKKEPHPDEMKGYDPFGYYAEGVSFELGVIVSQDHYRNHNQYDRLFFSHTNEKSGLSPTDARRETQAARHLLNILLTRRMS